jgi:hypothetical protein
MATLCEIGDVNPVHAMNTVRLLDEPRVISGSQSRAKVLWAIIRKTLLNKSNLGKGIRNSNSPKLYQITIKQGLQYKFHLKTKQYLASVVSHSKIPRNRIEGIIREIDDTAIDKEVENNMLGPKREAIFNANDRKNQETFQYSFTCTDLSGSIKSWDVSRTSNFKPKKISETNQNIKQIEFIPKYSLYASCSDDKAIKVLLIL